MKIAICGSMDFAREMVNIKQQLEQNKHNVELPEITEDHIQGIKNVGSTPAKIEGDLIRKHFEKIKQSDAILIVNISKNGVENYVGGNALIEMAFGHVLNKKVFLLNPIPRMPYCDEMEAINPIILEGNIARIQ